MQTLKHDLVYALRAFAKRPSFTLIAVLTLALGIGANTAIFSVVDATLLRSLPFAEPERLVVIWESNPELARQAGLPDEIPVAPGTFYDWQSQSRSFSGMAMIQAGRTNFTGTGDPEQLALVIVTGETFEVLGTRAALGRTLQPADDAEGAARVAVLSHALWQRRFGGDRAVVGRSIALDGNQVTVVGVMPPSFTFPRAGELPAGFGFSEETDLWVPAALPPDERGRRMSHSWVGLGRLAPGVGLAAAQAEMSAIAERIAADHPDTNTGWRVRLEPMADQLVGDVRPALVVLMAAVGLVLLIACVNVANLLLGQAAARSKEIAIRTALGAARGRLVRQLLTESLLLAGLGGFFGVLVAHWALRSFAALIPANVPGAATASLDGRVLAFTLLVSLSTGALAGLAPAFQMSRPELAESLRDGTRGGGGTARGGRTRGALVVLETAIAVLLLVGAGLLVRSFARLTGVDPGFRTAGGLAIELDLPSTKYPREQRAAFYERVRERLEALPGVVAVAGVSDLPMSGTENIEGLTIEGRPPAEPGRLDLADYRSAMPGYFAAMGIPLRSGRDFTAADGLGATRVAIVDEVMARAYWPGQDPIGKRLHTGPPDAQEEWMTVVGVVGNVRNSGLHVEPRPQLYVPHAQRPTTNVALVVRTATEPTALGEEARAAVTAVDRDQPIAALRTLEELVAGSVAERRFNMLLLALFAGLALLLAAVGIYGITAYSVAQRTREMGLRMALGAQPGAVLGLVMRETGRLALAGLAVGLVAALALTRIMSSLLFGVGAADPATFVAVAGSLGLVALAAAWVPGRRATRVDPMVALRAD